MERIRAEIEQRAAAGDLGWLISAAADDRQVTRALAAHEALVGLGNSAVEALWVAASSAEVLVRITAVSALAALDQPEADELLVRELESFDFSCLPSPRFFWWSGLAYQAGRRRLRSAVPALIVALAEGDDVTVDAAEALERIGDATAIEPLVAALERANPYEAMTLASVLREFGDPHGLAAIERWKTKHPQHADFAD